MIKESDGYYTWADNRFCVEPNPDSEDKKNPWVLIDMLPKKHILYPCRTLREAEQKRITARLKGYVPKNLKRGEVLDHVLNEWGDTDRYKVLHIDRRSGVATIRYVGECPGM